MSETSGSKPPGGSAAWASWIAFVAVMMMLIGVFSVIAGLAAVTEDGFMTRATGTGEVFLLSVQAVGFVWIVVGVIVTWTGWALIQGRDWARFLTIFLVCIHSISDLLTVNSHPFLSLLFIVVNLTILYGVTVKWEEAKIGMGD